MMRSWRKIVEYRLHRNFPAVDYVDLLEPIFAFSNCCAFATYTKLASDFSVDGSSLISKVQ